MKEIMRIGDRLVPADQNLKDIGNASEEITNIAEKYKADVLAIIGKGDGRSIVAQHHEKNTKKLMEDIVKIITIIETIAEEYEVKTLDVIEAINFVIDKGE